MQMEIALWHKFTQHKGLKKLILETGERPITYVSWHSGVQFFVYRRSLSIDVFFFDRSVCRCRLLTRSGALDGMEMARTSWGGLWRRPGGGLRRAPRLCCDGSNLSVLHLSSWGRWTHHFFRQINQPNVDRSSFFQKLFLGKSSLVPFLPILLNVVVVQEFFVFPHVFHNRLL